MSPSVNQVVTSIVTAHELNIAAPRTVENTISPFPTAPAVVARTK